MDRYQLPRWIDRFDSGGERMWFPTWLTPLQVEWVRTDHRTVEYALWVLVAISFVGDVVTTMVGLHMGLAEANPVARAAIDVAGVFGILALKGAAVALALACRPLLDDPYKAIVPAALAIPWTLAVCSNLYMIFVVA